MNQTPKSFEKYLGTTFLIGIGFFTMGLMDPLYDTYVPFFLRWFIDSKGIIGLIMTLDNLFALFLIPLVAALSDRTRTVLGRRMPYIIITLPLTAIAFAFIPIAAFKGFLLLILIIFLLNLFKQAARGPVVALMPDIIPGEFRSEANGVINTMGGLAAIGGTVGLARLMDVPVKLPGFGEVKNILPFPIAGIMVILATLLLFLFVKEKQRAESGEAGDKKSIGASLRFIFAQKDKSTLYILLAVLSWFLGYQGILPFIGLYAIDILKVSGGQAALPAGMVAIAYALFAIPSGILAHKFGRGLTVRICLIGLSAVTLLLFFHLPAMQLLNLRGLPVLIIFLALMFLFGIFWGSVVTNSFPMLWQMAGYHNMGIYTGLYYFFSQAAAIAAPPLTGLIIDLLGFRMIFLFASLCMLGAFVLMIFVKGGEAAGKENLTDG